MKPTTKVGDGMVGGVSCWGERVLWGVWMAAAMLGCAPAPGPLSVCEAVQPGDLVLTEVLRNPIGSDKGREYVELFNATEESIELSGLTLYVQGASGPEREKRHRFVSGTVSPHGYAAVGDAPLAERPEHLVYGYGDALGALPNDALVLGIRCGTTVIDEIRRDEAGVEGKAEQLDGRAAPDAVENDQPQRWCESPAAWGDGYGSPGQPNPPCPGQGIGPDAGNVSLVATCIDGATGVERALSTPEPGSVRWSEVMANPQAVSDSAGEWLELCAETAVDLNGLVLSTDKGAAELVTDGNCHRLPAGECHLLARRAQPKENGGLPQVKGTFDLSLPNTGGRVLLTRADGVLLDTLEYGATSAGVALQRGAGQGASGDKLGLCPATAPYGAGDLGTPGAPNPSCPDLPSSDDSRCIDGSDGGWRGVVSPGPGELVITEFLANPGAVADAEGEWIELWVAPGRDLNGLWLGNESTSMRLSSSRCLRPNREGYALFARQLDAERNGGVRGALGPLSWSLGNSGERRISVLSVDGGMLDEVPYRSAASGASTQLAAGLLEPLSHERPGALCASQTSRFGLDGGGDFGSPGSPNAPCP